LTLFFGLLFKLLPEARVGWRPAFVSAGVTAILFIIGRYLIGLYLGRSTVGSAYGAAGSLIVLLLWIFYAAQIFLFGVVLVKTQSQIKQEAVSTEERKLVQKKTSTVSGSVFIFAGLMLLVRRWLRKRDR
jgi:membrane protein